MVSWIPLIPKLYLKVNVFFKQKKYFVWWFMFYMKVTTLQKKYITRVFLSTFIYSARGCFNTNYNFSGRSVFEKRIFKDFWSIYSNAKIRLPNEALTSGAGVMISTNLYVPNLMMLLHKFQLFWPIGYWEDFWNIHCTYKL